MSTATAPLAPAGAAHRATTRRRIVTIPISRDLSWKGIEYRLAEPYRSGGAHVRPWDQPLDGGCSECGRAIRRGSRYVQITRQCVSHPACAIRSGFLIPVGEAR